MLFVAYFVRHSYLSREAGRCLGTFSPKNPPLLGEIWGIFARRIPLAWADFWGIDRVIETPFCEEFPLKVMKLGRRLRGWMGENGYKKEPIATNCYRLFNGQYSKDIMRVLKKTLS